MDPWGHIEELARPTVPPGPSEIIEDAIVRGLRGSEGLVALRRWVEVGGGLPLRGSLGIPDWWPPGGLIFSALEAAALRRDLEAVAYFTGRMQAEGDHLLDTMLGVGIAERVEERARELGLGRFHAPRPLLVRFLAAEATFVRRTRVYLTSPDRSRSDSEQLLARNAEDLDEVLAFWERVLGDAQLDEPYDTTVARLYAVSETSDDRRLRSMISSMARRMDRAFR